MEGNKLRRDVSACDIDWPCTHDTWPLNVPCTVTVIAAALVASLRLIGVFFSLSYFLIVTLFMVWITRKKIKAMTTLDFVVREKKKIQTLSLQVFCKE